MNVNYLMKISELEPCRQLFNEKDII